MKRQDLPELPKHSKTKNALIESVSLEINDHGMLDAWLHLKYDDGFCQGFGGYALYLPKSFKRHSLQGIAGHHLFRIMQVCDVEKWDKVTGKAIRVRGVEQGFSFDIDAIGHIIKDDWFSPKVDYADLMKKKEVV